jgi:hypothetical protein
LYELQKLEQAVAIYAARAAEKYANSEAPVRMSR